MNNSKISKKIQEIIKTATPKQKAILVVQNYENKKQIRQEPLLTEEEVNAIKDSLTPEQGKEYNKWLRYFDVYVDLAPIVGLAVAQYKEQAREIVGYLNILESYAQEENHLNIIYQELKDSGDKKALDYFSVALKNLRFRFAELKRDEEGYIEIDTTKLFSKVKEMIKEISWASKALKSLVVVVDEWTKKKKTSKIIPPAITYNLEAIKNDTAIEVAPIYSRKFLNERIAKGYEPTTTEREKAIFPSYEEIPLDESFVEMWRDRLATIENNNML